MNRLLVLSLISVFPVAAVSTGFDQKSQRKPNRLPSIESFTSSKTRLQICPFSMMYDQPEVTLLVNATDADGDSLHYEYSSTEGKTSGEGSSVVWHLDGLPRGPHEIQVTVSDGKGGKVAAALTVTTVDASVCDPPRPPCPAVKVSCPDEMDHTKPFIFSALVEGAEGQRQSSFKWKINAGRIVKGQYTHEIEANTTGALGFDNLTATVEVGGFDPSCNMAGSCTTKITW
jgi:hypothetical protein